MDKFKVIIADGQIIAKEGLVSILNSMDIYDIVSTIVNKQELLNVLSHTVPAILILDPDQLRDFAPRHIRELVGVYPISNILVVTANAHKDYISEVLSNGITHLILKNTSLDELDNALLSVINKEDYLCKQAIEALLNKNISSSHHHNEGDVYLTKKEIEIVRLVSHGLTTKEIAMKSYLSIHTVNTHRRNILRKLGFSNTSELVLYAVRKGIADDIEYYI